MSSVTTTAGSPTVARTRRRTDGALVAPSILFVGSAVLLVLAVVLGVGIGAYPIAPWDTVRILVALTVRLLDPTLLPRHARQGRPDSHPNLDEATGRHSRRMQHSNSRVRWRCGPIIDPQAAVV